MDALRATRSRLLPPLPLAPPLALALALAGVLGCGDDPTAPGPRMRPGADCGRCHSATSTSPRGPTWSAAGTIYAAPKAEAFAGLRGVTVRLTDAQGRVAETVTNDVGNFYFAEELEPPFAVLLERDGVETAMPIPAASGYCAACHTAERPLGGAPGRVFLLVDDDLP